VAAQLLIEPDGERIKALMQSIADDLFRQTLALHWFTGTAPISPSRSVTYFDPRSEENLARFPELVDRIEHDGVPRRYGESEKEYATLNASPSIVLRAGDDAPLRTMLSFVERTESVWRREEYELALASLASGSAPGLGWPMRLVLLVGACESLMLPDRRSGLQRTFTNRLACMLAREHTDVEPWSRWFQLAYELRSDVVHGRPLESVESLSQPPDAYVAEMSRAVVVGLCRLISYRFSNPVKDVESDRLWHFLDGASATASAFELLQEALGTTRNGADAHQFVVTPSC
jgi:hypothetical protein